MVSKKILLIAALSLSGLAACNYSPRSGNAEEDLIGTSLNKISKVYSYQGSNSGELALFDNITKKIHVFELASMTYKKSYPPPFPEKKHTVLHHPSGQYTIDLTAKSLTIFSKNGNISKDPVQFEGTPLSGAFNPDKNLLVVYTDTNSVIVLRMNSIGEILQTYIGGPELATNDSIKAGDVLADGNLVLILSNKKVVTIDLAQTLEQQKWIKKSELTPPFQEPVSWMAPLRDNSAQIAYYSATKFGILDITNGNIVDELSLPYKYIDVLSKGIDPHIITKEDSTGRTMMIYAHDSQIYKKELTKQKTVTSDSYLDIENSIWNFVDSGLLHYDYQTGEKSYRDRKLKSYRLTDMLAKSTFEVPDNSELALTKDYLLNLFPSDMGYATSTHIESKTVKEAKFFNNGVEH
jgi:hypothetical protein